MIVEKRDAQAIRDAAISRGFTVLKDDAVEKVMKGITTVEEVIRVTQKDIEE